MEGPTSRPGCPGRTVEILMTTTRTISDEQIRTLRTEAVARGDFAQVDLCNRALSADDAVEDQDANLIPYADWTQEEARAACAEVLAAAQGQS